jgi:hypothetical protein
MKNVSYTWLWYFIGIFQKWFILLICKISFCCQPFLAILLIDVFGIAGYHTWPFPIDPVFEDWDRVMGYSTPQRLSRELNFMERQGSDTNSINGSGSIELPKRGTEYLPV